MDGGAGSVKAIAGSPGATGATGTAPSLHAASATVSTGSNERDIRAVAINRVLGQHIRECRHVRNVGGVRRLLKAGASPGLRPRSAKPARQREPVPLRA